MGQRMGDVRDFCSGLSAADRGERIFGPELLPSHGGQPYPVEWLTVVRKLSPDELVWFVSRAVAFLGHSDPWGFAQRLAPSFKDARRDAERSFVLFEDGHPVAGAFVRAHAPEDDDQSLTLTQLWYERSPEHLQQLIGELFDQHPHEAVYAPLIGVPARVIDALAAALAELGFVPDSYLDLCFDLSEVPPIGLPLVLEAWTLASDEAFRQIYETAEGSTLTDRGWAWLKRWRGPFKPDLWFIARETLDQEPVGYALVGTTERRLDASYYLTAVGVLPEHRHSSEMLRRLVVSILTDLASRSPLGRIDTSLSRRDPKLIGILHSLGFETVTRYPILVKLPA